MLKKISDKGKEVRKTFVTTFFKSAMGVAWKQPPSNLTRRVR
jgi:hypothetical protein